MRDANLSAGQAGDAPTAAGPRWATSSFGDGCDTTPTELTALGAHVAACRAGSRFGGLRVVVQAAHRLAAPRLITTVALVLALLGAVYLVL